MAIPVDQMEQVTAARCVSCLSCVDACKDQGLSTLNWGPPPSLARPWPQAVLTSVLLLSTAAVVSACYLFPLPSFVKVRGQKPDQVASVSLTVNNLTCRGRANLLYFFLDRDDMFRMPGYFRLEAWPAPGSAEIRVYYDAAQGNETLIKQAITEPYFNVGYGWRQSPFTIQGYDILDAGIGTEAFLPSAGKMPLSP